MADEKAVDRKALGRRSRRKGQKYELAIRDKLKAAWGIVLERTPLSGGFKKSQGYNRFKGDLNTLDTSVDFRLHLELKDQKTWSIHSWWKQAIEDCPEGKTPMLIMHQGQEVKDGKRVKEAEDFVLLRLDDFLQLVDERVVVVRKEQT